MINFKYPAWLLVISLFFSIHSECRANEEIKIAILDFSALTDVEDKTARLITETFTAELRNQKVFNVITMSDIKTMLDHEQQKQVMGCGEDASCMAEIGGALGVNYLIRGSIGRAGEILIWNITLLDVSRAQVSGQFSERYKGDEAKALGRAVDDTFKAVKALFPDIKLEEPEMAEKPEQEEEKIEITSEEPNDAFAKAFETEEKIELPPKKVEEPSRVLPWTFTAIGVAGVAVGATFGIIGMGHQSELKDQPPKEEAKISEFKDKLGTDRVISMTGLYAGSALTVAGVVWLIISYSEKDENNKAAVKLVPSYNSFVCEFKF